MPSPIIVWFRRDFRLSDHPALSAACGEGRPVIPVFIHDEVSEGLGTAPQWRLGLAVDAFCVALGEKDSKLILRRGKALDVLRKLIEETGADTVYWSRLYDPDAKARDEKVKAALKEDGVNVKSVGGHLMFEPWSVETKEGGYYKVYTPFWKSVRDRGVEEPLRAPQKIPAPDSWPASDDLADWSMGAGMDRGAEVVRPHVQLGEDAARGRLDRFTDGAIADYAKTRDLPAEDGTSRLSENLSLGEISPHRCWHAAIRAREEGKQGAETFLKELVWREFAYHLMHHAPRLTSGNWREEWDAFPWSEDERLAEVKAWKKGLTGVPFVDAGMRELYASGRMHNRVRMVVASYLTKHLMCHWSIGQKWFEHCLIDWDPANNALGWQWTAGSGPDASPFFRVFNPETQAEKFDPDREYVENWVAELADEPGKDALSFFDAVPLRWAMSPDDSYPGNPVVGLDEGRKAALDAYENRNF